MLSEFEEHKMTSEGITLDYFAELKVQLDDFKKFIEEKLNNQSSSANKIEKFFKLMSSQDDLKKSEDFNIVVDSALQKFLLAKIHDDVSDTFPEFLKKYFKCKPGYNTWRYLFGNKEKKSKQAFIVRYAQHNEQPQEYIEKLIDEMNQDKGGNTNIIKKLS